MEEIVTQPQKGGKRRVISREKGLLIGRKRGRNKGVWETVASQ